MSGWIPTPADGWPRTLERLQRLAEPLTESEAITDLRWHVDQGEPLPGRRALRERWCGWSERAVRELLADTARWWDATKGTPPTSRGDLEARAAVSQRRVIPPASHVAPTHVPPVSHRTTDEPGQSSTVDPTRVPPASHVDPTHVHARAPIHPAPSPSPSPTDTPAVSTPAEPVERPTLQLVEPAPAPRLEEAPTVVDALPSWARRHRTRAAEVADGVIRCLEAIRQRPVVSVQRCATDALHVTRLWEQLQRPPMAELVAEVELVARWAREAPSAENDIRGIDAKTGRPWTKDRSREVSTLLRPERWADRLADAQRWDEGEDQPAVRGEYRPQARASPDVWADVDPDMPF